jgi:ribosome-associated translation inhibitor RaiA
LSGAIREQLKKESFMQIQVHSDNHIEGSARLVEWVSASVASKLERFDDELTRIVVHLHDDNGAKAGAHDKRCQIEARPKGLQPLSVTHKAESLEQAIDGSIEKLHHALEHQFGKLRNKRATPLQADEAADISQDALLREDFLAEEQLRAV